MKFCCLATQPYGVPTTVSINSIMGDGTGMCGACRVEVGGQSRFVCVDDPKFDGHQVDWNQLLARQLRESHKVDGQWDAEFVYAILADEWNQTT